MEIELRPDQGDRAKVVIDLVQSLLSSIFTSSELSLIDKFIISETDKYKSDVKSVNPSATVSDNEIAVGVAKTIFIPGKMKSTIVIVNHQIAPLIDGYYSGATFENWTIEQLSALYTSIHEIGHAIDHAKRTCEPTPKLLPKLLPKFKFEQMTDYYYEVITSEIGANISISDKLPLKFKRYGRQSIKEHASDTNEELQSHLEYSDYTNKDAYNYNLIGYVSIIILKLQEYFIHRLEKEEKLLNYFGIHISNRIENWIKKFEIGYPNWGNSKSEFKNILISILNRFGFELIIGNEIDDLKKNA